MTRTFTFRSLVVAIFFAVISIILFTVSPSGFFTAARGFARNPSALVAHVHHMTRTKMTATKTPVYFFGHGGPTIIFMPDHEAYKKLEEIGKEITQKVKPKAVVVFSAHWEGEPNVIEVNTAENTDLIYDFYNFPKEYYKTQYPQKGSPKVAAKVIDLLTTAGIKTQATQRGPDHGVWVPFRIAFSPTTNPLNVPIVQVSLYANEDPVKHYAVGRALSSLRSEGVLIIVSGMAVHNLRDLRFGLSQMKPYAVSFDEALREAVEANPVEREEKMCALLRRDDARRAHPSFEHLLPIHVGAGAAGEDKGVRVWTLVEGCLSWAQFRFGEVGAAA